jgi:hypothetical protein
MAELWLNFRRPGSSSLLHRDEGAVGFSTLAFPLDVVWPLEKLDRPDYVKIDVEGAEARVLAGADETVRKFRPIIQLETGHLDPKLDLPGYSAWQSPGGPNKVCIPDENAKKRSRPKAGLAENCLTTTADAALFLCIAPSLDSAAAVPWGKLSAYSLSICSACLCRPSRPGKLPEIHATSRPGCAEVRTEKYAALLSVITGYAPPSQDRTFHTTEYRRIPSCAAGTSQKGGLSVLSAPVSSEFLQFAQPATHTGPGRLPGRRPEDKDCLMAGNRGAEIQTLSPASLPGRQRLDRASPRQHTYTSCPGGIN